MQAPAAPRAAGPRASSGRGLAHGIRTRLPAPAAPRQRPGAARRAAPRRAGAPRAARADAGPAPRPEPQGWSVAEDTPASSVDAGAAGADDSSSGGGASASVFREAYHPWRWNSKLRYYTAGDSGPVLLLVHGCGLCAGARMASAARARACGGACPPLPAAACAPTHCCGRAPVLPPSVSPQTHAHPPAPAASAWAATTTSATRRSSAATSACSLSTCSARAAAGQSRPKRRPTQSTGRSCTGAPVRARRAARARNAILTCGGRGSAAPAGGPRGCAGRGLSRQPQPRPAAHRLPLAPTRAAPPDPLQRRELDAAAAGVPAGRRRRDPGVARVRGGQLAGRLSGGQPRCAPPGVGQGPGAAQCE
jgi:hypothetical protein